MLVMFDTFCRKRSFAIFDFKLERQISFFVQTHSFVLRIFEIRGGD